MIPLAEAIEFIGNGSILQELHPRIRSKKATQAFRAIQSHLPEAYEYMHFSFPEAVELLTSRYPPCSADLRNAAEQLSAAFNMVKP